MKTLRALVAVAAITLVGFASTACAAPQQTGDPVANAIHANFGDTPQLEAQATNVARCESGLNPNAVNPNGGYYGLFQLSKYWHEKTANAMGYTWAQITDPAVNARVARQVYNAGGWSAWGCRA